MSYPSVKAEKSVYDLPVVAYSPVELSLELFIDYDFQFDSSNDKLYKLALEPRFFNFSALDETSQYALVPTRVHVNVTRAVKR